jgi:hypothetical protein
MSKGQSLMHLLEEAQLKQVFDAFKYNSSSGRQAIDSFFTILPKSKKTVDSRCALIYETRNALSSKEVKELWLKIRTAEEVLKPYIETSNDLTTQIESEIFFTGEHTKIFNSIPYLISILIILKVFVTPIMGLMLPLIFLLTPFFILKFTMNVDIPWDTYVIMMKELILGIRDGQQIGLKHITQIGYLLTSFGQGMFQPILTAQQTYKTDSKICEVGKAVNDYIDASRHLYKLVFGTHIKKEPTPLPNDLSSRDAYMWFRDNPLIFKSWQQEVGMMDVYFVLAKDSRWSFVSWSKESQMKFDDLSDLCIKEPVKSNVEFDGHNLLTGPNRGGKSSFLRAVLQQILFARVFGITSCTYMEIPWIHWIHSRIRSLDKPGEYSLFEEDVRSCAGILQNIGLKTHGLVLIDELFHSTNPPDALFCAQTFLGDFWRYETVTSLISTHSFELLNDLPACVRTLCCPATEVDGKIKYTYRVEEGVCKLSSVREVLAEAGLRPL